jgi:transcription elongation factor GreA-like protein
MREEFEKLAAAGKLEVKHIEALVALTTSGYCHHRSWGFGRIKAIDTVFSRFTIDFQTKSGHYMDLGFAANLFAPFLGIISWPAKRLIWRGCGKWQPCIIWT